MAGVPLIPWEAPPLSSNIYASEIMSHPVVSLRTTENVGHIAELLKCVSFNGFPVVDPPAADRVGFIKNNLLKVFTIYFIITILKNFQIFTL